MDGKTLVKLAADLSVGAITEEFIKAKYGSVVFAMVIAAGAGYATNSVLNTIDEETGIVSDMGSLVDDIFSIF